VILVEKEDGSVLFHIQMSKILNFIFLKNIRIEGSIGYRSRVEWSRNQNNNQTKSIERNIQKFILVHPSTRITSSPLEQLTQEHFTNKYYTLLHVT